MNARRIFLIVIAVFAVLIIAFVAWAWRSSIAPIDARPQFEPALVERGAQLAALGNCAECHTAAQGAPYAGGYPLETQFGTIYGTNITPDAETGIGRWSLAAFGRAMREGVDREGRHLYPAFPYDHFALLSDADIEALYAYLMTRTPVRAEAPENDLPFPLNVRMFLAGWKALFFQPRAYAADASQSEEWNRGAYLVQGIAHCGACHTPRNFLGAEKREAYMAGGQIRGWIAPALTSASPAPVPWTAESLHAYLLLGIAENHSVAAGPMAPVVTSLRGARAEDVQAMATYLAALMGEATPERAQHAKAALEMARADSAAVIPQRARLDRSGAADDQRLRDGAAIYAGTCAMCHATGRETSGSMDALHLALSTAVALPEPLNLLRVTLKGLAPPAGTAGPMMPGYAQALSDEQIASLAQFLRHEFSDQPAWRDIDNSVREVRRSLDR